MQQLIQLLSFNTIIFTIDICTCYAFTVYHAHISKIMYLFMLKIYNMYILLLIIISKCQGQRVRVELLKDVSNTS